MNFDKESKSFLWGGGGREGGSEGGGGREDKGIRISVNSIGKYVLPLYNYLLS